MSIKPLFLLALSCSIVFFMPLANAYQSFPGGDLLDESESFKPCYLGEGKYAGVSIFDYCPSYREVYYTQPFLWSNSLKKLCIHNGEVYDIKGASDVCHFNPRTLAPNRMLIATHKDHPDDHECILDDDIEGVNVKAF